MINADEALRIILDSVPPVRTEKLKLADAAGRTIAEEVVASQNLPAFANSSMDGFAVRAADLEGASSASSVTLSIAGEASAGKVFAGMLLPGSTVHIMTGGKLPQGADTVVPIESVKRKGKRVAFSSAPATGEYVRLPGEDVAAGDKVVSSGDLLGPAHLGILASLGFARVRTAVRPHVRILATGDELVKPERSPGEGQIRNSTSYALMAHVRDAGGKPEFMGIVRDKVKKIQRSIREGLESDILLITGGVSAGQYDLVRNVLERSAVDIRFHQVNIKPGKPMLFGMFDQTLIFGLPGNPVSTGVTFLQFVRPAIRKMLGRSSLFPSQFTAITDEPLSKKDGKRHFIRGIARGDGGVIRVRTTGTQSSAVLSSLLKANCLIILPEQTSAVPSGASVTIEFFRDPF